MGSVATTEKVQLIELPKIEDDRGNLTFVENFNQLPFEIKRLYWIYDVPGGQTRGGHAFKRQMEVIIALSGSFDVVVNDTIETKRVHLNRSYYGLFVNKGLWRYMDNFSTNSLALVLCDTAYDKNDYIKDYNIYKDIYK